MNCEICRVLADNDDIVLMEGVYWRIALCPIQTHIGRLFVTLRDHKSTLGELTPDEWTELGDFATQAESAITDAFSPTHFNWQCLMNNAVRDHQSTHVHWHVIPRYDDTVLFNGLSYTDATWPNKYDSQGEIGTAANKSELIAIRDKIDSYL